MFRKLKRIDCNYKFFLVVYPLQYLSSFESYGVSALRFDCTLTWLQFWPLEFFLVCLVYSVLLLCNVVQYNLDYPNTLVIGMRKSVRIVEINIKSMRDDFHLILQKVLFSNISNFSQV